MTEHVRYVVETPDGFLGVNRYSYKEGTRSSSDHASLNFARIYTRKVDAERACAKEDKVRKVTITLVEES